MRRSGFRRTAGLLLAAGLGVSTAGCGGGEPAETAGERAGADHGRLPAGEVRPGGAQGVGRRRRQFQKANPGVIVKSTDQQPCFDPKTFGPKLAGGQMETVFVVPVTNYDEVIGKRPGPRHHPVPRRDQELERPAPGRQGAGHQGRQGLRRAERALQRRPGLQPQAVQAGRPRPRRPAEDLGRGPRGAPRRSPRSAPATSASASTPAATPAAGTSPCTSTPGAANGHPRRQEGRLQLAPRARPSCRTSTTCAGRTTAWAPSCYTAGSRCMMAMGGGKVGMMLGAPDVITDVVQQVRRQLRGLRHHRHPRGARPRSAAATATCSTRRPPPTQIRAGMKWIDFQFHTAGKGRFDFARGKAIGNPVGLPDNDVYGDSPTGKAIQQARKANADAAGGELPGRTWTARPRSRRRSSRRTPRSSTPCSTWPCRPC